MSGLVASENQFPAGHGKMGRVAITVAQIVFRV
jgi:hypothetical protein